MFCRSRTAAVPLSVTNLGTASLSNTRPPLPFLASGAMTTSSPRYILESVMGNSAHISNLRTSLSLPVIAAAAAIAGETRWVRPPLPCRPSKLRLDVEAQRSWGRSLSGFIAKHMEQPGSRQSKPASMRMVCRPSASACSLTIPDPGTTIA